MFKIIKEIMYNIRLYFEKEYHACTTRDCEVCINNAKQ